MDLLYKKKEENKNGVRVQPYRPPLLGTPQYHSSSYHYYYVSKHHDKLLGVSPPHQ